MGIGEGGNKAHGMSGIFISESRWGPWGLFIVIQFDNNYFNLDDLFGAKLKICKQFWQDLRNSTSRNSFGSAIDT